MPERATRLALLFIGLLLVGLPAQPVDSHLVATILKRVPGDRLVARFRLLLGNDRILKRSLAPGIQIMLHWDDRRQDRSYYYGNHFLRRHFWYFPKTRQLVEHAGPVSIVPADGQWLLAELESYAPPSRLLRAPSLFLPRPTQLVSF